MHKYAGVFMAILILGLWGCGGGGVSSVTAPPAAPQFSFSLSSPTLRVFQTGPSGGVDLTVTRNGSSGLLSLTVSGLPAGAAAQIEGLGSTTAGTLSITPGTAAAGAYNLKLAMSDGQATVTQPLTLTVGVTTTVDTATTGNLNLFMSTSFQPAEWDYQFFTSFPAATTPLTALGPQHIRIQAVSQGVPQTSASTWSFAILDSVLNPVFTAADHNPEFQIAVAPAFLDDPSGHLLPANFSQFAAYSAQLVRYYNAGGFIAPDGFHVSSSGYPITYWGVFNEPNLNGLTALQYTALYNQTVPTMQAVDSSIKFVAVELSDYANQDTTFIPTFVAGVTAQVDVMATHFYSTCNQKDSDQTLFATIPDFANRVSYLYSQMQTNPALLNVPVWITENNVNADFDKGGGISACNGTAFVVDPRGSSAYFTAWRPYMFSQMAKAGAKGLYTWVFAGDVQYGELNDQTGQPRLSYWVDYWLQHFFPSPPGAQLLHNTVSDNAEIETLAARNPDGSIVIMVANHALASPLDNNGPGAPRDVLVDVSQLGTFTSAQVLTIDGKTDIVNGPTASAIALAPTVEVDFSGYGVAFLLLK